MSNAKHTPLTYARINDCHYEIGYHVEGGEPHDITVAECYDKERAQVFAAAPDMLEELKTQLAYWKKEDERVYDFRYAKTEIARLSALIAKATGGGGHAE